MAASFERLAGIDLPDNQDLDVYALTLTLQFLIGEDDVDREDQLRAVAYQHTLLRQTDSKAAWDIVKTDDALQDMLRRAIRRFPGFPLFGEETFLLENVWLSLKKLAVRKDKLARILAKTVANYTNYDTRYDLVLRALSLARKLGYTCGFRHDPSEPDWPVVVIVLPLHGEVSWHMPPSKIEWDKSTPEDVKQRCMAYGAKRSHKE